jgi:hypothetical protein
MKLIATGPFSTPMLPTISCKKYHSRVVLFLLLRNPADGVCRLQVTTDISHWVVVCERLLDQCEEDQEILTRFIPHVRFTNRDKTLIKVHAVCLTF